MSVDVDLPFIDRLAKALHRMAEFDSPKRWTPAFDGDPHVLGETAKEAWREQANRFAYDVALDCGILVKNLY